MGEVGGTAEVAPIVLVGAEGEDFLALGGEAEVGGDDGEDVFFDEHGEEAGGKDVDAGEGESVKMSCRPNNFRLLSRASAAAGELVVVVEEELARRFAGLNGESGKGTVFGVELEHGLEVDVADDVDIVQDEGCV